MVEAFRSVPLFPCGIAVGVLCWELSSSEAGGSRCLQISHASIGKATLPLPGFHTRMFSSGSGNTQPPCNVLIPRQVMYLGLAFRHVPSVQARDMLPSWRQRLIYPIYRASRRRCCAAISQKQRTHSAPGCMSQREARSGDLTGKYIVPPNRLQADP